MSLINKLEDYRQQLLAQERAEATISKYIHDVRAFLVWCEAHHADGLTKAQVLRWRDTQAQASAPATVNAAVAAVNGFLHFIGRGDCCVLPLRVQRTLYRERRLELTREEYFRLLRAAEQVSE